MPVLLLLHYHNIRASAFRVAVEPFAFVRANILDLHMPRYALSSWARECRCKEDTVEPLLGTVRVNMPFTRKLTYAHQKRGALGSAFQPTRRGRQGQRYGEDLPHACWHSVFCPALKQSSVPRVKHLQYIIACAYCVVLVAEYAMSLGFFRRVLYLSFAVDWGGITSVWTGPWLCNAGRQTLAQGREVGAPPELILQLECRNMVKCMCVTSASHPSICALPYTYSARLCVVHAPV